MNGLMDFNLTEYTKHDDPQKDWFRDMRICPRFSSIATLLIGLQVLNPTIVETKVEIRLSSNISSNQFLVAASGNDSQMLAQSNSGFEPPDNGGPDKTQGSGTR